MRWYDSREVAYAKTLRKTGYVSPLPKDLQDLLKRDIRGYVILPENPDYEAERQGHNKSFDTHPAVIVICACEADVRLCLKVGKDSGLSVVGRSGGHSTAGFSSLTNAIVIDMRDYDSIDIDKAALTVTVGAGCNFRRLNGQLEDLGLHLTGGSCGDVCVAGFMMGGGYGWSSRLYGMNCDLVLEAEVMLTDGRIVIASNDSNPDLFRALRGGTGSNFGILLRITYQLQDDMIFAGFSVRWDLSTQDARATAAQAMHQFQTDVLPKDTQMGMHVLWAFNGEDQDDTDSWTPAMMIRGVFRPVDPQDTPPFHALLKLPGAVLEYEVEPMPFSDMNVRLLTTPYNIPQILPEQHETLREAKLSRILGEPLPPKIWGAIMDKFAISPSPYTLTAMEVYGGVIPDEIGGETVFVHRKDQLDFFVDVFWWEGDDPTALQTYLQDIVGLLGDYWKGGVYQNYPNADDVAFAGHFWGDYYQELNAVKQKYDLDNILRYPQGIGVVRGKPSKDVPFLNDPIVTRPD